MTNSPFEIRFTTTGGLTAILAREGDNVELPTFEGSQAMFELEGVELANAFFRPTGNAAVKITLEVEELTDALHDSFLDAEIAAEGAVDLVNVEGSLSFVRGTEVTTYPKAVIQSIRPGLPVIDSPAVTRVFTIEAGLPV